MSKYTIVIEKTERNYSAYIPNVPGCIATGATIEETRRKLMKALEAHLELMRDAGEPIPLPSAIADYVQV